MMLRVEKGKSKNVMEEEKNAPGEDLVHGRSTDLRARSPARNNSSKLKTLAALLAGISWRSSRLSGMAAYFYYCFNW
jgi:hypothetical protein